MDPTTSPTYNLLDEPWIQVVTEDGATAEVSLTDVLKNAGRYRALASDLATMNFAVLRVLLAVLYRAWDDARWRNVDDALDHWDEKWTAASLWDDDVERYLDTVRGRFDLRHPETPFMQVADLHTAKGDHKPVSLMIPDVGGMFSLRTDVTRISAAEAARCLIHCAAYDYSGIKSGAVGDTRVRSARGYPMGVGVCGWYGGTVIHGDSLRETLLLNYVPHRESAGTDDLPVWEMPPLTSAARPGVLSPGPVELLTWPQRRIRLFWSTTDSTDSTDSADGADGADGDAPTVDGVLVCNGDAVDYTMIHGTEMMTPWRFSAPQTQKAKALRYMPQALDKGRAMWRSLGGILPNAAVATVDQKYAEGAPAAEPARTVEWLARLVVDEVIPRDRVVRVEMVSPVYGSNMASLSDVLNDSLTVRSPLLGIEGEALRAVVRTAVDRTEGVAWELTKFSRDIRTAAGGDRQSGGDDVRLRFFDTVDASFRRWLADIGDGDDTPAPGELPDTGDTGDGEIGAAALAEWGGRLRSIAWDLADEIVRAQGPQVWAGRPGPDGTGVISAAVAQNRLSRALRTILGDPVRTTATADTGSAATPETHSERKTDDEHIDA
ncbi:type I-E CRISPR-associated protein Cse1/CasA [Corynebacterium bovis]|uniref:type I-E CRISPR-associated protein Cse1/CasA n=1 Tax=Corynebacterium bovis TaxID=36808 RepID=UPI002550EA28|nr:type I-E CRISPR-associated protein Cse1/CasA [Corynebacterium bovis]MDK8510167.1 type I-E CRISPR-associated protein Cse1/CasA [Corynebacterium bovis]